MYNMIYKHYLDDNTICKYIFINNKIIYKPSRGTYVYSILCLNYRHQPSTNNDSRKPEIKSEIRIN